MRRLAAALALLATPAMSPSPASADGSTAELDNNGLRLLHEPDIAMTSQDLTISPKAVHAVYEFVNHGAADKTATLAFPMPDVTGGVDANVALPSVDVTDPFHFRALSGGVEAGVHLEASAFLGRSDVTARLKALRLPLMPLAREAGDALDRLKNLDKSDLVRDGLAARRDYAKRPGGAVETHLTPLWTWRAAYVWRQTFPVGKPVRVVQDYAPSVGGAATSAVGSPDWTGKVGDRDYNQLYCLNASVLNAIRQAPARAFAEARIDYILKSGVNWAGPIGRFHLTVDTGAPETIVSFCGADVRKRDAAKYEVSADDYTPADDLHILLLSPHSQ